jgi:CubicO group peptidase (beta-lactamase class C family)
MKRLIVLFALICAAPLSAAPPQGLDARVEALRTKLGVPGAAVAIVENGQVTHARGYGVRDLANPQPVDADTIFSTGSTGKAFTAAALAILVDEGKIGWDDRVIDHIPWFRMYDAWVTREMTVRDLLVHRSGLGLGAGDLLFIPKSDLSRKETVRRIRYIKPATSFRSGYAYDNILYMVAGQLIEEVTGQSWEQFVKERILRPLGMNNSTVDDAGRLASANRARPHARLNGKLRGMGDQVPLDESADIAPNAAPAGGMAVSANDMTRWLLTQLAHGKMPNGGTLFSEAVAAEMWKPVVLQPGNRWPGELKPLESMFSTYALGWTVQDYRGAKLVWHSGGVFGSLTVVVLLPDRNTGFFIVANSEEGELLRGLMYELLDHYLGLPKGDWPEKLHAFRQNRFAEALKVLSAPAAKPVKSRPSLPLSGYAGQYNDPWYGTVDIRQEKGALVMELPHSGGIKARLDHWQYNTFRTVFPDNSIEPAYVTFSIDAEGKVDRITMKAISPLADFSWDWHDLLLTPVKGK